MGLGPAARGVLLGLGVVVVALASPLAGRQAQQSPLIATGAWVREAPGSASNSAAYLTLRNPSTRDVTIVAVRSDVARSTELHEMRDDNGVMRMRKADRLVVPAGGTVELKPGGWHVMLIGLTRPLAPGDPVHLVFTTLEGGQTLAVGAQVRANP